MWVSTDREWIVRGRRISIGLFAIATLIGACVSPPSPTPVSSSHADPIRVDHVPAPTQRAVDPASAPSPAPASVPTEDDEYNPFDEREPQRQVALEAPGPGRVVVYKADGATITMSYEAFVARAAKRHEQPVLDFLGKVPVQQASVSLNAAERTSAWGRILFVVASLLDRGEARVRDDRTGREVGSIIREQWTWEGCSGGCRQSGRQYRLQVPGDVFLRTTDLFEDSM